MSAIFAQRLKGSLASLRNLVACTHDVKGSAYKGLVRPVLEFGSSVSDLKIYFFKMNLRMYTTGQLDS